MSLHGVEGSNVQDYKQLRNVFQQLYNLVDSIIVGKLVGTDALAAIGVTGSVTFLFFALCNGIGSGGGIVTSQYFGSGDTSLGFVICGIIKRKYRVKNR